MLMAFWSVPASLPWLQWVTVFMIGFFLYGPQMLIGLCGAELVGPESVGASEGFLGWVAYLGKFAIDDAIEGLCCSSRHKADALKNCTCCLGHARQKCFERLKLPHKCLQC